MILVFKMTKLLIVDDEQFNLNALERCLKRSYEIVTAISGAEALERLTEGGVDMIISDWDMPEMHGSELVRVVRTSEESYSKVPIIMISGGYVKKSEKVAEYRKNQWVQEFLVKPADVQELHGLIVEYCNVME